MGRHKALQARKQWRDVRVTGRMTVGKIVSCKHGEVARVQHQLLFAPVARAWGKSKIEAAADEHRACEKVAQSVPVAQAKKRRGGKVGARRFTADRKNAGAEDIGGVPMQPERGCLAVVGSLRIGMLGRKPVLDGDRRKARSFGNFLQARVLFARASKRPSATMNMEKNAAARARLRPQHTKGNVAVGTGDRQRFRVIEPWRGGEGAKSLGPSFADDGRGERPLVGKQRQPSRQIAVEGPRFLVHLAPQGGSAIA